MQRSKQECFEKTKVVKADRSFNKQTLLFHHRPPQSNVVNYPSNMALMFGPIVGPNLETGKGDSAKFPNNITFLQVCNISYSRIVL